MNSKIRNFLIIVGVLLILFLVWYFRSIIAYIIISAILSIIGKPLVNIIRKIKIKGFKIPKALNAFITLIVLWFFLFLFFRVFIPLIAYQANEISSIDVQILASRMEAPIQKITQFIERYNIGIDEGSTVEEYITEKLISVLNVSFVSDVFGAIASIFGNLFIAVFSISFMTFFFLKDDRLFYNGIMILIPDKYVEGVAHVLSSIKKLLTRYFLGIVVQVTCIIVLISIGLTIVGVDFKDALVTGLVVGIMNVIPYLGPVIGASFGLLLGFATHLDLPFYQELLPLLGWMLLVFVLVQVIDNVVFQPVIYSNSVNAHPMEIFLVIMMAGSLAGIAGMILAIPAYTILRVVAKEFFNNFKVVKKLTEKM